MFSFKKGLQEQSITHSLHLILGVLGVVREPRLPPCIADCLHADVFLCVNDPLGDVVACGSRDWEIWIL